MLAANLTWKEFSELSREKVVIVPIGSLEQHGTHLPLGNDTIVSSTFAEKVAERINGIVMPPINYGYVYTFSDFPGTFGVSSDTLTSIVREVGEGIINEGFRNILFLNAHDENHESIMLASKKLGEKYGVTPLIIEWSQIAKSKLREIKESRFEMHGGEALTSLFLHWYPDMVRTNEITDDFPIFVKEVEDNLYRSEDKAHMIRKFDISEVPSGTCGAPSKATVEKGKLIEESIITNICNLLLGLGWVSSGK